MKDSHQFAISELFAKAVEHHRAGRLSAAEDLYRQVVQMEPRHAEATHHLGVIAAQQGNHSMAVDYFALAVDFAPDRTQFLADLANAYGALGQPTQAIACFRKIVELEPQDAGAHNNLGNALSELAQSAEAETYLRSAIALDPNCAVAHNNLGNVLKQQGDLDRAIASFQRAANLDSSHPFVQYNLGNALVAKGELSEAATCFRHVVELQPNHAGAYNNLGCSLDRKSQSAEAIDCFHRALTLQPGYAEAAYNLANALKRQGRVEEASQWYRRTIDLDPRLLPAWHSAVSNLNYHPGITLGQLAEAHQDFERYHCAPLRAAWQAHCNPREPERRLRLGLVSPDFHRHPVAFFLIRALENLDREQCEIVVYNDQIDNDEWTARFRAAAGLWRDVVGWNDVRLAEQVRADGIDVLFDLVGHTLQNRLRAFARKPAPVQITWIGYEGTTGLAAMDCLLADRHVVPKPAEPFYCERVVRMPDGYVCYDPPPAAPPVSVLPASKNGLVTFASFNRPDKINSEVVAIWSEVLRRLPDSCLVLKYKGFDDESIKRRYLEMFAAESIEPRRLEFLPWSPYPDYFEAYQAVDIALDPFPFSGSATTCEALWMGVPVITLPGETFASRHSLSHLSNIGLTETIAIDREDYVRKAAALASDLPRLAGLRSGLRDQMAASALCDGQRFANNFMSLLRDVWRQYCVPQRHSNRNDESHRDGQIPCSAQDNKSHTTDSSQLFAAAHQHLEAGRLEAAESIYRQLLQADSQSAHALNNLAIVLQQQHRLTEAVDCCRQAIAFDPNLPLAHYNLANTLRDLGHLDEAVACFRRAVELEPNYIAALNNLGNALMSQTKFAEAVIFHRKALDLAPNDVKIHCNLGATLAELGQLDEAAGCYRRALDLDPTDAAAHSNLGNALKDGGLIAEAVACHRRAIELDPHLLAGRMSLLYSLHYQSGVTLGELAEAHEEFDRVCAAPLRQFWQPHLNDRNPSRRLRLGLVSADFCRHPVSDFLVRGMENLDHGEYEITCYSGGNVHDDLTARFKAISARWRHAGGLSDQQLAEQIRADQIDVLFDLAGYTRGGRPLVFARKPAPLQIAWIGYEGTTGLSAMDYLLADRHLVPHSARPFFREKVLWMPDGYVCCDPHAAAPPVSPLPALSNGVITFGCFNNLAKITPEVVAVWASVLQRVNKSRLVLKYRGLGEETVRRRYFDLIARESIEPYRLVLLPRTPFSDYLATYSQIDIALDPFPFSGGATTCDALWQGVPVITLPGETFASRHSLSHLSNIGLTETIAIDREDYVRKAAALASDLPRLAAVRSGLRNQMAASPLCDGRRFADNFTSLLRDVWRQYCQT